MQHNVILTPEQKLATKGMSLIVPQTPINNYRSWRQVGNLIYLAGHGPQNTNGVYMTGKMKTKDDIKKGYLAAQVATISLLSTLRHAIGDLSRVDYFVKLLAMVNSAPDFEDHPSVIDGCSDLLVEIFGEAGYHARSAVGMSSLPHGMMVEIEAIVKLRD